MQEKKNKVVYTSPWMGKNSYPLGTKMFYGSINNLPRKLKKKIKSYLRKLSEEATKNKRFLIFDEAPMFLPNEPLVELYTAFKGKQGTVIL